MSSQNIQHNENNESCHIKYKKYDFNKRKRLIQMVQVQNKSLASAAKDLLICQTTARLIMKIWKEEGRVFQKKIDKLKREKKQARKLIQAKKKEKLRIKKLSRRKRLQVEAEEEPQYAIKQEEISLQVDHQTLRHQESLFTQIQPSNPQINVMTYNFWLYPGSFYIDAPQYSFGYWTENAL